MQLINDKQLTERINNSTNERVTAEDIESHIVNKIFRRVTDRMTLCILTLDNGFSVTGESSCVSPENYDKQVGKRIAYDNAFNKLWPLFGFLLAERLK